MKFRKNWKRFWTLDRHHAEGFTLVELIVVIAILAILAGVGTVGYSGYVKKANMQADITLASEIEQALLLAAYSGTLEDGSCVVVYADGTPIKVSGSGSHEAMVAAFGENYANSLKLSYDGWTGNAANIDVDLVSSSSFGEENLSVLLGDVSLLTNVLSDFFSVSGVPFASITEYAESLGVDTSDPQAMANVAVFDTAANINAVAQNAEEQMLKYYVTYCGSSSLATYLQNESVGLDQFSSWAVTYGSMEGLINYLDAQISADTNASTEAKAEIQALKADWVSGTANLTNLATLTSLLNTTQANLVRSSNLLPYYQRYVGNSSSESIDKSSQAYKDGQAFLSYMAGVEDAAPQLAQDTSALNSSEYFKSAAVANAVNNYLLIASQAEAGAIVVSYNNSVVLCYPLDYSK